MKRQIPLEDAGSPEFEHDDDGTIQVADDLAYKRLAIANVIFVGKPHQTKWVLVDAGVPGTAAVIAAAAEARFGEGTRPTVIVLTHGHFDHVGALESLAEKWDVPIYAHDLERPYLDGGAWYPPPDSTVGGGLIAALSPMYPRGPVDVQQWLQVLPDDGSVPQMSGWRWIHTPGHTPGHVSLWREADRSLIVGDAFITTRQESVYAALMQKPEMHGPPMYYTQDFDAAHRSVHRLACLAPELVITGHGRAMTGKAMLQALRTLDEDFDVLARPAHGRYKEQLTSVHTDNGYWEG
jgi:glyoxylase-like metal-dependent hydrolase (beta-lactamase superfamily II)